MKVKWKNIRNVLSKVFQNQTVFLAYYFRLRVRLTSSQRNLEYLNDKIVVEKKIGEKMKR